MADIISITREIAPGQDGLTYFETTTTVFDNEEQTTRIKRIGTANVLENLYADNFEQRAQTIAANAIAASQSKRLLNEIETENTALAALTTTAPAVVLRDRYETEILAPGWEINEGSGFVPFAFSINAQGVLKYSVNGANTKNADFYGAVIQLKNYPAQGTDTQFFQIENGKKYISLPNRQFTIKKP
jgi:hypothetical protein